jgi:TctA family transporter
LQPLNLLVVFLGVLIGTIIGMLPGIGPINAIAILIPISFALGLPPTAMLILFSGIYYGSQYGNSISTILLNVPGTASSVATALDGYPMAQKGRGGPALAISAIASFFGGTLSIFGLVLFAPLLAQWAIRFGPAEYFVLIVFTFTTISALTGKQLRQRPRSRPAWAWRWRRWASTSPTSRVSPSASSASTTASTSWSSRSACSPCPRSSRSSNTRARAKRAVGKPSPG